MPVREPRGNGPLGAAADGVVADVVIDAEQVRRIVLDERPEIPQSAAHATLPRLRVEHGPRAVLLVQLRQPVEPPSHLVPLRYHFLREVVAVARGAISRDADLLHRAEHVFGPAELTSLTFVISIGTVSPFWRAISIARGNSRSTFSGRMWAAFRHVQATALKPASAATAAPSSMLAHSMCRDTIASFRSGAAPALWGAAGVAAVWAWSGIGRTDDCRGDRNRAERLQDRATGHFMLETWIPPWIARWLYGNANATIVPLYCVGVSSRGPTALSIPGAAGGDDDELLAAAAFVGDGHRHRVPVHVLRPELLAGRRVERAESPVVRRADEDERRSPSRSRRPGSACPCS